MADNVSLDALDDVAYLRQLQALLPTGAAWPREDDSNLTRLLSALAQTLANAGMTAGVMTQTPDLFDVSLGGVGGGAAHLEVFEEWEASLGLSPVDGDGEAYSMADRVMRARFILTDAGGASSSYFARIAELLGMPGVTVDETGAVDGDPMPGYLWRVNLPIPISGVLRLATCNDDCNMVLGMFSRSFVEEEIYKRRQAHTEVIFAYLDE